jgi:hypothetical protein
MTAGGRPLNKAALLRIESGERGLQLDEALALALLLNAAPHHMLSPAGEEMVSIIDSEGFDSGAMRNWLRYGNRFGMLPEAERHRADLIDQLVAHAQALVDAHRGNDIAGRREAAEAIVRAVERYQEADNA